jgi:hypothetical protein
MLRSNDTSQDLQQLTLFKYWMKRIANDGIVTFMYQLKSNGNLIKITINIFIDKNNTIDRAHKA